MRPDISIIVPACNVADFIGPALASALAQRGPRIEVIVIEDGSTDDTAARIEPFLRDPRLRLIRQPNRGLPAARNAGLAAAEGRMIGFLDGDDVWDPRKAAIHLALMDARPEIDFTYSWWNYIDAEGAVIPHWVARRPAEAVRGGLTFEGLLLGNFVGNGSTAICRRDAILRVGGFEPLLRLSCEDLDYWLRIALLRDGNIALVPEVLTSYRRHKVQASRDWRRMLVGWEDTVERMRERAPDRVAGVVEEARALLWLHLARSAMDAGDIAEARRLLLGAWSRIPKLILAEREALKTSATIAVASLVPGALQATLLRSLRTLRRGAVAARATLS